MTPIPILASILSPWVCFAVGATGAELSGSVVEGRYGVGVVCVGGTEDAKFGPLSRSGNGVVKGRCRSVEGVTKSIVAVHPFWT